MNFSKTTEYALRILSLLAMDEQKLYSAKDIFQSSNIPFRYLRKLLIILSKSDLIDSEQGKNGGYRIAKKPSDISLFDVVHLVGDAPFSNDCFFGFDNCNFIEKCAMHEKWMVVRETLNSMLMSTTLEDVKSSGSHCFNSNNNSLLIKKV